MFRTIRSLFSAVRTTANTIDNTVGLADDFVAHQRAMNRKKYMEALKEVTTISDDDKKSIEAGAAAVKKASEDFDALQVTFK